MSPEDAQPRRQDPAESIGVENRALWIMSLPPRPRGVDPAGGPVSTQRTSAASPSEHPAKIVGIPRFLFGVQRLNGVDVSTMDTRTCQAAFIGSPSSSGRAAPPWGPARASASEVMTLTCLRSEETRQRDECTPRSSGARALRTTPLARYTPDLVQCTPLTPGVRAVEASKTQPHAGITRVGPAPCPTL